jgi:hypothetical protein
MLGILDRERKIYPARNADASELALRLGFYVSAYRRGLSLLGAFAKIDDPALRGCLIDLVESLTDNAAVNKPAIEPAADPNHRA